MSSAALNIANACSGSSHAVEHFPRQPFGRLIGFSIPTCLSTADIGV
jgi:hypothetical protein